MPQKYKVHSFRGLLIDGGQDQIRLERQNANLAYRITKFQIMHNQPGTADLESTVQIWKTRQDSVPTTAATVDFSDSNLLGAAYIHEGAATTAANTETMVIFDLELFSRDIYVTHTETSGTYKCNYYIELTEVPVAASTLMQIKLGTARRNISGSMGRI